MGPAVSTVLPLAVAVAISPLPILMVIVLLLGERAQGGSVAFLLGWTAGIVLATGGTLLAVEIGDADKDQASTAANWLELVLGTILVAAGIRQWVLRPGPNRPARGRGWLAAIGSVTPARGAVLGLLLSAANPKNLTLCVAAGVAIAGRDLVAREDVVAILAFTGIAVSTVALPVAASALAGDHVRGPLDWARARLSGVSGTVLPILLGALGLFLVAAAVSGLR
jgi:hypothetical protein